MPEMTPVAAGIIPPNPETGINTFGSILGIQRRKQELQQGQQNIQSKGIELAGAQMGLGERQRVQQIIASGVDDKGESILDEDGSPDPDKALKWMPRVAPTTYPTYLSNIQTTLSNKLGLKSATADLGQKYRDQIGGILQAGINDPGYNYQQAADALTPYGAQNPEAAPAISHALSLLKHLDGINTGNPKADLAKKNDMLVHVIQALKPSAAATAGTMDVGGSIQPGSVTPFTGKFTPAGAPVGKTLSPQLVTTPAGPIVQVGGGAAAPVGPRVGPPAQAPLQNAPPPSPGGPIPANLNITSAEAAARLGAATGGAAIDTQRAESVSGGAQSAQGQIQLTKQADQLADMIHSGKFTAAISEAAKAAGSNDPSVVARAELKKVLGQLKDGATSHAGSDARLATALEQFPDETAPNDVVHSRMDWLRGTYRINQERKENLNSYQKKHGSNAGFQQADDLLTSARDPLMSELHSMPKGSPERAAFIRRAYKTPDAAQDALMRERASYHIVGAGNE